MKKIITTFVALIVCYLFPIDNKIFSQNYYKKATAVGVTYLSPIDAKIKKTDPYWGGEVSGYWKNFKLCLGLNIGNVEKDFGYNTSIKSTDMLINITADYLYGTFPEDNLSGLYGAGGIGWMRENAEFKGQIAGQDFKEKIEKDIVLFNAGVGYLIETGAVEFWHNFLYLRISPQS